MDRLNRYLAAALCACAVVLNAGGAFATTSLPDVGVDVGTLITDTGTALGTIVASVVGLYAAFLLVRFAMKWMRKSAG